LPARCHRWRRWGQETNAGRRASHCCRDEGRTVIRISADDFHHPRAVQYRRGRASPEGFWPDTYDYEALHRDVLRPLGPGGDRRFRPASHDLRTDQPLDPPWQTAPAAAVAIIDGLFLHRDGLACRWQFSVGLDVPFASQMPSR
jgi:uridine kinase